jgi:hypothetical protein
MAQTLTKSVEKKAASKYKKILINYKNKISALQKSIQEFKNAQEESVKILYNANNKIKEYEEQLNMKGKETSETEKEETLETEKEKAPETEKEKAPVKTKKPLPKETASKIIEEKSQGFNDLPSGSNRKLPPI